jgi:colanic acid biosynthesis glycosyl transferase WcaI
MRFLLLTQYYPPEVGAAPVRLQAMVRELTRRGHQVDVVTALPNYPTGKIFEEYRGSIFRTERRDGATVRRVWIHAATGSGVGRMLTLGTFALMAMIGMLRTPKPDVVLVESPPLMAAIPALIHRLIRRRPNVLLLADLWPDTAAELGLLTPNGLMFRFLIRLEQVVYRSSWRISPVTRGQIETLITDKGVAVDKIVFLPNGVDTELFAPSVDGVSETETAERVVLFAGTLGYAQGLDVILDASRLVRAVHPETRFVFVGGGSDRERLRARVLAEGLTGIEFREPVPVEDVASMYRECFAGITSLRASKVLEGARPSKIFPIMASGRPVVYSGDGEGARLVTDACAGVTAAAEDHQDLADVLVALLGDPSAAAEMGMNGRRFVEHNLAWSELIDSWLDGLGDPPSKSAD